MGGLKDDGTSLAKGMEIKNRIKDKYFTLSDKHKQMLGELKKTKQKAALLEGCQRGRALDQQRYRDACSKKLSNMQKKVDAADTRATIAKRGYTLCQGDLDAAKTQGASMQAEAMKAQSQIADRIANSKTEQKAMREKITAEVSDKIQNSERDRYDNKLRKAISKVSKTKPISPKCQACGKLSVAERQATGADCSECPAALL